MLRTAIRRILRSVTGTDPRSLDPDELLSASQVAAELQVSRTTVHDWIVDGLPVAERIPYGAGRTFYRIRRRDALAWYDDPRRTALRNRSNPRPSPG